MSGPANNLNVKSFVPVGASAAMREALTAVEDVACGSTTVLLLGESGTGKEVFARHIHHLSRRSAGPWVAVNCAALPAELLESELFGHERGAFTGANDRRVGRIEQAHNGTLLLDEISELPLPLQAKLLRVLQEREVDRVGGTRPIPVDVRVIATSNRSLEAMVADKQFRADLYYRLCVFPITLPALRERREDIPLLAQHLTVEIAARLGRPAPALSEGALACLLNHDFPGNVRELGNVLERALVRCRTQVLGPEHLDGTLRTPVARPELMRSLIGLAAPTVTDHATDLASVVIATPPSTSRSVAPADGLPAGLPLELAELERMAIIEALRRVGGNRTHAARLLGISLRTLRNKLRILRTDETLSADGQIFPVGTTAIGRPGWAPAVARNSQ